MKTASLILASLFIWASASIYIRNVRRDLAQPSSSMFLIRSVIAVINCVSYLMIVNKDLLKVSVTVSSTLSLSLIFLVAYLKKKLTPWRGIDLICAGLAMIAVILWKTTGSPLVANIMLQVAILLAMTPAIIMVWKGILKERPLPWVLPASSYAFAAFAIVWESGSALASWRELIHPIAIFAGNSVMAFAAWRTSRKQG